MLFCRKKFMSNNWSEFKLRINTTASVEKAYKAVATPGGLESWFLREAEVQNRREAAAENGG